MAFVGLACLLTLAYGPNLTSQERETDLEIPAVVLPDEGVSHFWEDQVRPLSSDRFQDVKEEPPIDLKAPDKADRGTTGTGTTKAPGCAHSGGRAPAVDDSASTLRAEYRQGMKRYASADFVGALKFLSTVAEVDPESELAVYSRYFMGESSFHLGRHDEALIYFQQVIDRYPTHPLAPWAHYSAGWIRFEMEHYDSALAHLSAALREGGQSDPAILVRFLEGEVLSKMGETETAVLSKRGFLEWYPDHPKAPEVRFSVSVDLFHLGHFREAQASFRKFTETYPSHAFVEKAFYGLGLSLIHDEKNDKGISVLETTLARFPDTPLTGSILLGLIRGYLRKDAGDRALDIYQDLVRRFPQFDWTDHALFDIGCFYLQKGEYRQSVEIYQDLLREHPGSDIKALVYLNLGEGLYQLGDFENALRLYRLVGDVSGERWLLGEALFRQALCLYQQKAYGQAIEFWASLVSDFPDSKRRDEACYWMGVALLQSRDWRQAAELFRKLEENDDIYPRVLNSLGLYYLEKGEWSLSIRYFLELVDRYPGHPLLDSAYLHLGEAFYHRKDYQEALVYLGELVGREGAPDLDRACFLKARIFYEQGRLDRAIDQWLDTLRTFPKSSLARESRYWIAQSYCDMGLYDMALEEFTKLTEDPFSAERVPQVLLRVGDCHYHLTSYLEASLAYLEVIRRFPEADQVPEAEYGLILAFEAQGRYDNFEERAKMFFSRYPSHPLGANILSRIAQRHVENDDLGSASAAYRTLIRKYPRSELADDAQFKLGEIHRDQEDFENAIVEFGRVVKHYPRSDYLVDAYFETAQSYRALEDYRKAAEVYELVVRRFPDSTQAGEAYLRLAECLGKMNRSDLAEEKLLDLMGSEPETVDQFQAALRLGLILFHGMRYGEAIEILRKVTKSQDPDIASLAQLKIGEIYWEMGNTSTAIIELMKTVHLYPGQRNRMNEALLQVGEIYMEEQAWNRARQICSRIVDSSPSASVRERAMDMLDEIDRRTGNQ